jgi:hypothetical protein
MFLSIASLLGTSCFAMIVVWPTILAAWLDPTAYTPPILASYLASWRVFCANVKVNANGEENIPAGPVAYTSNHVGNFCALILPINSIKVTPGKINISNSKPKGNDIATLMRAVYVSIWKGLDNK